MKNKNIKVLILFAATLFVFVSCDEWLDVQPSTQLDRSELFKTEQGYSDALLGVYGSLSSTSLYGREMTFGTMDVLAGYYTPSSSGASAYYYFYTQYPYKRSGSQDTRCVNIVDAMWSGMYNAIVNLNSILETIDENESLFSGENYNVFKGEAIGLRAFIHLDLLRMYGSAYALDPAKKSIPFVDTLVSLVSPLLTVEQAGNRIISELEKAITLMENDPIRTGEGPSPILATPVGTSSLPVYHNRKYHFNYYAAKAALARVYLWMGDKVNALKFAKELIDAQEICFPWVLDENLLAINSTSAYNRDRTFTTEHVFALNIPALENYIPDHFIASSTDVGEYFYCSSGDHTTIYENNSQDPRNQYLFTAYNSNWMPTKLYQDQYTSSWFKSQIPLIRISEMYYIAAECEPNFVDGLIWLNTVREARKLTALSSATITSADVLQSEIQKEYQKEFICEGQLWFYYKRLNLSSLPLTSYFSNTDAYVFDLPDNEITYGGREE